MLTWNALGGPGTQVQGKARDTLTAKVQGLSMFDAKVTALTRAEQVRSVACDHVRTFSTPSSRLHPTQPRRAHMLSPAGDARGWGGVGWGYSTRGGEAR